MMIHLSLKKITLASLSVVSLFGIAQASESIQNLKVTPSDNQVMIQWDKVNNFTTSSQKGYALQWAQRQSDIKNNKPAKFYTKDNLITLRKRSFDVGTPYYFRVYTYQQVGRNRTLYNGSKILKWTLKFNNEFDVEEIEATGDVELTASGAVTNDTENSGSYEFSPIRVLKLDTFADIHWSHPRKISKSEYSGYKLSISEKSDFSNTLKTENIPKTTTNIRLEGLTPETTYYIKASFTNNGGDAFGTASIKSFKTTRPINRNDNSRAARNIKKIEKKAIRTINIGQPSTNSTNNTETTSQTEEKTEKQPRTTTAKDTTKTPSTKSQIQNRIQEIYKQIRALQKELRALRIELRKAK